MPISYLPQSVNPLSEGNPRFDFERHPSIIVWELTRACSSGGRIFPRRKRDSFELSTREALRFIEQAVAARPSLLMIAGGDLTERPDLNDILGTAFNHGLRVGLHPVASPNLLKVDFAALKQLGVMQLSLDLHGSTAESHDHFAGVEGSWEWITQSLVRGKQEGLQIQINTVFTHQNLGEFEPMVQLIAKLAPDVWNVSQYLPREAAKPSELFNGTESEAFLKALSKAKLGLTCEVTTSDTPQFRRVSLQNSDPDLMKNLAAKSINDGRGLVFVTHLGEIRPGPHLPINTGNVRESKLLDIYRNNQVFRGLRNPALLKGKCGYCEYNSICGGSRGRAYGTTGDYLAQDPVCIYEPKSRPNDGTDSWRMYCDD